MNKFIRQYNEQKEKNLRNVQSKTPKEYWKILNNLKTRNSLAGPKLEEFYEHFKLLNENNNGYGEILNSDINNNEEILNSNITSEEILRSMKKLNNGKASGLDLILNEHIKSSS